ncbi:MAG TPA: AraC family transcriptional regulator [Sphingobacterium sp.]|nr:AraC family transcriptional regulator [Sphingobacterium sp.]
MRVICTIQKEVEGAAAALQQVFNVEVAPEYDLNSDLIELEVGLAFGENSTIHGKVSHTDGLLLFDQQVSTYSPLLQHFTFDTDVVVLEFYLEGHRCLSVAGDHVLEMVSEKRHNLRYVKKGNYESVIKPHQGNDIFLLFLSPNYYFKLLHQHSDMHKDFARGVSEQRESFLSVEYLTMNQDMRTLISNVRTCTRRGSFHRLCLEIKILELLMLQYEQHHALQKSGQVREDLHPSDQEKLYEAKEILDQQFRTPPTIRQLAMMVGVNEFKLKTGFKKTFQTTIHSYVVKKRMQIAYEMMQTDSALLVRQVALEVGYQNPSHFSAAFKEYFGYGPSEMV